MDEDSSDEAEEKRRIQQSYSYRLIEAGFWQLFEQANLQGKSFGQLLEERRLGGREKAGDGG